MNKKASFVCQVGLSLLVAAALLPASTQAKSTFGVGAGFSSQPDQFVLAGQAESSKIFETARFVPSAQLGLGNSITTLALNADARWYLFSIPESGLRFYGSAGPSLVHYSGGKFGSGTEMGINLTAGLTIPTRSTNHYNVELRFGFGDIPDFKAVFHLMFGH